MLGFQGRRRTETMKPTFSGKMHGMANIVYIMGLIAMCSISLAYIVPSISRQPEANVIDIALENTIFIMQDSLELAKVYIDDSAMYSVFQASYDNGQAGGLDGGCEMLEHEGESYALWYNNKDIAPTLDEVEIALQSAVKDNFRGYTDGKVVTAIFTVVTPTYSKITVRNLDNHSIGMEGTSNADLSVAWSTEGGNDVTVWRSSKVSLTADVPYYKLYHEALAFHRVLHEPFEERLVDCDKGEIEKTVDGPGYTLESKVMDTEDGACLVKVEVSTKKSYPVWDGDKSVLEKISLVFMERLGPEQCRMCMSSGSLAIRCKESCDDDEYPSRTVFKDKDDCIEALDAAVSDLADDDNFYTSRPETDTLFLSRVTGIPVDELLSGFPEGGVEAEHTPPMSRLSTIPGSDGEFRVVCTADGKCSRMFCKQVGLYQECTDLAGPQHEMLDDKDKEFVFNEVLAFEAASKDCEGEVIPCGPWSIYHALQKLGIQATPCEINEKRKPSLLSLRRFLSIFSEDAMMITWPDQLVSILEDYGLEVETRTGSDDELRRIAIEEAEKPDKAVILRMSLDERNKLLSQHFEHARKNLEGEYLYLDVYKKPIHEIYIASRPTA